MSNHPQSLMDLACPQGVERIDSITAGYQAYQVLRAALELGLFDWLAENGPGCREEITTALKLNGMFTRSFLQALVDLGFLTCKGEKYRLTELARDFLVRRSPCYQGDLFLSTARPDSWWNNFKDTLTVIKPPEQDFDAVPTPDFIKALAQRSLRGELQAVTRSIVAWEGFRGARTLLDLGGGHGFYAIALCQVNPNLRAVVFDKPHIIACTREFIRQYGLEDRVIVQGGDACSEEWGGGYDIVLISHLLYKYRKELAAFIGKAFTALKPGGLLACNHWFCAPGCGSEGDGLRELDRSIHSFGHPLCHMEEFNNLLATTGFSLWQLLDVPSAYGMAKLHLAVKKGLASTKAMMPGSCSACC
ncbi:O-methyltransferase [Moorella thermoacetica]|uniref:N,N-dimethyltransferase OxyT n=3 Tax=Neomoorella thermoacetica TaxID=1525 RepID=A0A1D7XBA5_NEOTH|nr:methyltransferase dimerization domain-containing protein [Moorella thermoacetica]AKX94204.1 O-methyltransferase [Moorella thermoacetica]AKX96843.1 O-methyltransferase [Moorella thermoacetica]AOQ24154.1 O-methyltransferase [Moorella thermoacetica]OIQ11419.1 O-methyltransferase [Moorella thermoacetica]OIQ58013.1 O-methyltransferase [Moorella thermoacetica]